MYSEQQTISDAKNHTEDHDFSSVFQDITQLQERDKNGANPKESNPNFGGDLKQLNEKLHSQGILKHVNIIGLDGHNHLLTEEGTTKKIQDASHFTDGDSNQDNNAASHDGGLLSGLSHTVESITHAVEHPLDAITSVAKNPLGVIDNVALLPLTTADAVAGTHTVNVAKNLQKGAAEEVMHHPVEVATDVAIGAGLTALTVATGGGFALALGGTAAVATEAIKNNSNPEGEVNGAIEDAKGVVHSVADWSKDAVFVADTDAHTPQEQAVAEKGLQQAGGASAHIVAGAAGGIAGGVGTGALRTMLKAPADVVDSTLPAASVPGNAANPAASVPSNPANPAEASVTAPPASREQLIAAAIDRAREANANSTAGLFDDKLLGTTGDAAADQAITESIAEQPGPENRWGVPELMRTLEAIPGLNLGSVESHPSAYLHPDVTYSGTNLLGPNSTVGEGAELVNSTVGKDAVVMPDAYLRGTLGTGSVVAKGLQVVGDVPDYTVASLEGDGTGKTILLYSQMDNGNRLWTDFGSYRVKRPTDINIDETTGEVTEVDPRTNKNPVSTNSEPEPIPAYVYRRSYRTRTD